MSPGEWLAFSLFLLDELSRERGARGLPLSEAQTDALERAIAEERRLARASGKLPKRARQRRWSKGEDARLAELRGKGMPAPAIGRAMGRSPWSVRSRWRTIGKCQAGAER